MTNLRLTLVLAMAFVTTSSFAQSFDPLYRFIDNGKEGAYPSAGVIRDPSGNLYGVTVFGGSVGGGVVFRLDVHGTETVLHNFVGPDGSQPAAPLVRDSQGNLYGTTTQGGTKNLGVVFKLDRAGKETVLYNFTGGKDGDYPSAGVIRDSSGNLYGTTLQGGTQDNGTVYKLEPSGKETVLYRFRGGSDGSGPAGELVRDSAGNLFGFTARGGHANGTVFKIDASGRETVLYRFRGGADGSTPAGSPALDSDGNLYGVTSYGGDTDCASFHSTGCGTAFKLTSAGTHSVLHVFEDYPFGDGAVPLAGVVRDSAGNLYGTTSIGGIVAVGSIFKIDASGAETLLYSFANTFTDGGYPDTGLFLDAKGNLYGTTPLDGDNYQPFGTVYEVTP